MKKKPTRGGKREGAGRKPRFDGEEMTKLNFFVPVKAVPVVKKSVAAALKTWADQGIDETM